MTITDAIRYLRRLRVEAGALQCFASADKQAEGLRLYWRARRIARRLGVEDAL